ncbi:hypothetical protein TRVA0_012S02168 [Trichomonascus vanleenenianus]|uniref:uncharacterized protein n=1 Tax=Trichomonascus vanleenenianus TaxID=2268995 RepID=UPI003ECB336C
MKFSVVAIALAASASTVLAKAPLNGFANAIYSQLPVCAQHCVKQSTTGTGCNSWDAKCLCKDKAWNSDIAACFIESCSTGVDITAAVALANSECEAAGAEKWHLSIKAKANIKLAETKVPPPAGGPSTTPGAPAGSNPTTTPGAPAGSSPTTTPGAPAGSNPTTTPGAPAGSNPTTTPGAPAGSSPTTTPSAPAGSNPTTTPFAPAGTGPAKVCKRKPQTTPATTPAETTTPVATTAPATTPTVTTAPVVVATTLSTAVVHPQSF